MRLRRIIQRRVRHEGEGTQLAADVNAVVSANVNEHGRTTVSGKNRVVQRSGRSKTRS